MTSKRRKVVVVLFGVALIAALAAYFTREREPSFKGRPLSAWLIEISPRNPEATSNRPATHAAIRAIGTNATPYLLKWLTDDPQPSSLRGVVKWGMDRLPLSMRLRWPSLYIWAYVDMSAARAEAVPECFGILGPAAIPAIPQLEAIVKDSTNPAVFWNAATSLAAISTNATPVILAQLSSPDPRSRQWAAWAIGKYPMLQQNPDQIVPLLLRTSLDTNQAVRYAAACSLSEFNIPAALILSNHLADPLPEVRARATNLLHQRSTNAPPQ